MPTILILSSRRAMSSPEVWSLITSQSGSSLRTTCSNLGSFLRRSVNARVPRRPVRRLLIAYIERADEQLFRKIINNTQNLLYYLSTPTTGAAL